jgi:hypothetical protein
MAAVGADDVRRLLRAAFWTGLKLLGLQGMVGAAHAGAGIGLFALGDSHGGNLSEMLASKGFGESISVCGRAAERQGRENIVNGLLILFGDWQLIAGLKIITSSGALQRPLRRRDVTPVILE